MRDHICARRLDLNLLQGQVAAQIGVHEQTITNWERNATSLETRHMPAILDFLGYNPMLQAETLVGRFASLRRTLGFSQEKVAKLLGVDESTVQGWEAGEHEPMGRNVSLIEQFLSFNPADE